MSAVHYSSEQFFQNFTDLKIQVEPEINTVWVYLDPQPRPCMTLKLLEELKFFHNQLIRFKGKLPYQNKLVDIHYHVVTSNHSVFNFGGDLDYFLQCIENKDEEALWNYAKSCIDIMYPNLTGFDLGITTISLIHGNALGGGFEAALSSNVLISEKEVDMGLPEVLFNLFPGMGAYNLLSKKLGDNMAEKMILSGKLYSSEELYEMGLLDVLAEEGEGKTATYDFINKHRNKNGNAYKAIHKIRQIVNPIDYQSLLDICDVWVEMALSLTDKDKRTMNRLVKSQLRFSKLQAENDDLNTSQAS